MQREKRKGTWPFDQCLLKGRRKKFKREKGHFSVKEASHLPNFHSSWEHSISYWGFWWKNPSEILVQPMLIWTVRDKPLSKANWEAKSERLGQVKENVKQNRASKPSLKQNNQISSRTSHHKPAVRINPTPNSSPPQKGHSFWGGGGSPSLSYQHRWKTSKASLAPTRSIQHPAGAQPCGFYPESCSPCLLSLWADVSSHSGPSQLTPHCYTCILSFLLWLKIHNMTPTTLTIFRGTVQYIHTVVNSISRNFSSNKSQILFPLNNSLFSFLPTPDNLHSTSCFYEFDIRYLI